MGQQSLIYSFVARGTEVLAEYTEFTGNFNGIAAQCLQRFPSSNNKSTHNFDGHTFNYLVEDGYSELPGPDLDYLHFCAWLSFLLAAVKFSNSTLCMSRSLIIHKESLFLRFGIQLNQLAIAVDEA